uniref:Uncharacterized protein n=1 Tax=Lepeophtheirus salmonis TaxID=72036 RepID=A0A0K2TX03_LEPSM
MYFLKVLYFTEKRRYIYPFVFRCALIFCTNFNVRNV